MLRFARNLLQRGGFRGRGSGGFQAAPDRGGFRSDGRPPQRGGGGRPERGGMRFVPEHRGPPPTQAAEPSLAAAEARPAKDLPDDLRDLLVTQYKKDDGRAVFHVLRLLPKDGAMSIKALTAALPDTLQEALAEKFGGVKSFLESRRHAFVVKPHGDDGVLYVAATPQATSMQEERLQQRSVLEEALGLKREPKPPRDPSSRGRGRGRGGFRGGRGRGDGRGRGGGFRGRGSDRGRGGFAQRGGGGFSRGGGGGGFSRGGGGGGFSRGGGGGGFSRGGSRGGGGRGGFTLSGFQPSRGGY